MDENEFDDEETKKCGWCDNQMPLGAGRFCSEECEWEYGKWQHKLRRRQITGDGGEI